MTLYSSTAEIGAILQRSLPPEEENALGLLIELVSGEIDEAAGFPIRSEAATVTIPGSWDAVLEIPAIAVSAVSAISINGVALATGSWRFDGHRSVWRYLSPANVEIYSTEAEDLPETGFHREGAGVRYGGNWGGPISTVTISFTSGLTSVPATIRSICIQAVSRSLNVTPGVKQEMLGSYMVIYDRPASGSFLNEDDQKRIRKALGLRSARTIMPAL